jgi:hypothetical protein
MLSIIRSITGCAPLSASALMVTAYMTQTGVFMRKWDTAKERPSFFSYWTQSILIAGRPPMTVSPRASTRLGDSGLDAEASLRN